MKKPRKMRKKLAFSKNTIRRLARDELDRVVGGDTEASPSLVTCFSICSC